MKSEEKLRNFTKPAFYENLRYFEKKIIIIIIIQYLPDVGREGIHHVVAKELLPKYMYVGLFLYNSQVL